MILNTKQHYQCHRSASPAPKATDAMLLLRRMEFVQSITRCEAVTVFACPAAPLLRSHCINSGESTPKAWKRHTPLSLLQDPDTAQIHDEEQKKKKKREKTELRGNTLLWLFDIDFWCVCSSVYIQYKPNTQLSP